MKSPLFRTLALLLLTFAVGAEARAQSGGSAVTPTLKVSTADGSVQANGVTELRFPVGAVQISGRTATVNPGSGSVSSTATQPANLLFASPSGAAGPGQWRRLVNADVDAAAAIAWSKVSKTMADIVATLGYAPLAPANNLSDLDSASAARTNLGLGTAAVKNAPASGNAASGETVLGSDTRLSDARTPTSHTHPFTEVTGPLGVSQMPALTGDVTTTAGSVATTLGTVGTPGTYTKVTTDAKGRVTSGTTLSALDVPAPALVGARVYHSTTQALTSGTSAALSFNSERFDAGGVHDTVTNTDRLTAPSAGYYSATCQVEIASNSTGYRGASIRLNAAGTILAATTINATNGDTTVLNITAVYHLAAGDYLRCYAFQNAGVSLNVTASTSYGAEFSMFKVGN